ncbi:hypothetical protein JIN92_19165 [Burkholderia contaminans]|nr:hypothetical protein [Burkholderia contaminans]
MSTNINSGKALREIVLATQQLAASSEGYLFSSSRRRLNIGYKLGCRASCYRRPKA